MKTRKNIIGYQEIIGLICSIIKVGKEAIKFFNASLPKTDRRNGFYLTVMDARTGEIILVVKIGHPPIDKCKRYVDFSIGKARKLFASLPLLITSFESKDELDGWAQGAICFGGYIWSVSGQEPENDEALAMYYGLRFHRRRHGSKEFFLKEISKRTNNLSFNSLEDHLQKNAC